MTKVLLAALTIALGALLTAGGMLYDSMAEDVDANAQNIERLNEAVQDIKTYQAVDQAQQQSQTILLQQMLEELKRPKESQ